MVFWYKFFNPVNHLGQKSKHTREVCHLAVEQAYRKTATTNARNNVHLDDSPSQTIGVIGDRQCSISGDLICMLIIFKQQLIQSESNFIHEARWARSHEGGMYHLFSVYQTSMSLTPSEEGNTITAIFSLLVCMPRGVGNCVVPIVAQ